MRITVHDWFAALLPYNARVSGHPVFRVEAPRSPYGEISADHLMSALRRRVLTLTALLLASWFVLTFGEIILSGVRDRFVLLDAMRLSTDGMWAVIGASLIATLWLDHVALSSSIHSINRDQQDGRWDLLRLTPLGYGGILVAKHAAAQLRAWRMLTWVIALRVATFALILLYTVLWTVLSVSGSVLWDWRVWGATVLLFGTIGGAIFILEPLWRAKAMTALGIAISAQTRSASSASLMSIGAMIAVWIAQIVVLIVVLLLLWMTFLPLLMFTGVSSLFSGMLMLPCVGVAVFLFYDLLKIYTLRRALRCLTRLE